MDFDLIRNSTNDIINVDKRNNDDNYHAYK